MASLKELRNKIGVIESTRKVTSAMKLVAGVKLRKAEQKTVSSREYSSELNGMLSRLRRDFLDVESELFTGRKHVETVLLIIFASDRGLCGNFNYLMNKGASSVIHSLHSEGKKIKILCVGAKLLEQFKKILSVQDSIEVVEDFYRGSDIYEKSKVLANKVISLFRDNTVDKVSIIYTKYYSAMNRKVESKDIIPLSYEENEDKTITVFEPNTKKILDDLVPYNVAIQIYQCALESIASEQSSRMTSMDNATRNADSLLSEFRVKYNRIRQTKITQELMEVISGAEAIIKG